MKLFVSIVFAAASFSMGAQVATSQDSVSSGTEQVKHIDTRLRDHGYSVRFAALSITRDSTESVLHLRGNVQVEMWATSKPRIPHVMILRADTVEYHEETGEIDPYGNVRLTVRDAK